MKKKQLQEAYDKLFWENLALKQELLELKTGKKWKPPPVSASCAEVDVASFALKRPI